MNETQIIEHYFKQAHPVSQGDLKLGIGDDAAIITVPEDSEMNISMDTLVAGVHFFAEADPADIAYKALAVNLSDMAAMGALPRWITLSLTLPEKNIEWLKAFSTDFNRLCESFSLVLVGGDLVKGPLSVTVQIHGIAPKGKSLRRSGANVGDLVYVTGKLGAAAYVLQYIKGSVLSEPGNEEKRCLHRPEPRVKTGIELRDSATSCIDLSDGLLTDLQHILKSSGIGAELRLSDIPYSESLLKLEMQQKTVLALASGDDYELCFTLPRDIPDAVINDIESTCPINCIGKITRPGAGLVLLDENNEVYQIESMGYQHF